MSCLQACNRSDLLLLVGDGGVQLGDPIGYIRPVAG
jgi:hypothetical protein